MFLAIDIGNSNIKFGVFDGDKLVKKFSIATARRSYSTEINYKISKQINTDISAVLICSVVPKVNQSVVDAVNDIGITNVTVVENNIDLGLTIGYVPITDLGTDRLINAYSAVEKYGTPCIVCSLGTALTIDAVNKDREFLGGLIAPGMLTMAKALNENTSRLPVVEVKRPDVVIQNTTVGSIRSGVFYGFLGQFESLVDRVKSETGKSRVIATGGLAALIAGNSDRIDIVDDDLLLFGLNRLFKQIHAT